MTQSLAPIVDEAFSLAKESLQIAGRMPKLYRFSLGQKISDRSLEILSDVTAATAKLDLEQKKLLFQKIQREISQIHAHYRLAFQLKLVSEGLYPKICLHYNEIYSQAMALEKWSSKN
jgi:hypothetical protein